MSIAIAVLLFVIAAAAVAIFVDGDSDRDKKPDIGDYLFIGTNLVMGVLNIAARIPSMQILTGVYLCVLALIALVFFMLGVRDTIGSSRSGPSGLLLLGIFAAMSVFTAAGVLQLTVVA